MVGKMWDAVAGYRSGFVANPSTYFEVFEPRRSARPAPPVMMIAGGVHSGACYAVTPDGRPGWAAAFLEAGHPVVLIDWPGVGRSGFVSPGRLCGDMIVAGLRGVLNEIGRPAIVMTHSISGAFGWKLLELSSPSILALIAVAPAPPGNMDIRLGELVGGDERSKTVRMASGLATLVLDETLVLDKEFQKAKLVGASTRFPMAAFNAYYASLQGISGRVAYERTNIDGAQLRVADFSGLGGKPVLLITGTADADHPRALDASIVDWLNAHGATARHLYLGDIGIEGNGHMMMLEDNSDEIADVLIRHLRELIASANDRS
jgi:pimeloyl-ACP methyl ester carboxylesterase